MLVYAFRVILVPLLFFDEAVQVRSTGRCSLLLSHRPWPEGDDCSILIAGGGTARAQPLPRLAVVQPKMSPVDGPLVDLRLIVVERHGATLIFAASVYESGKLVCQASEQVTTACPAASFRSSS
jgi:hypothetical protein